MNRFLPTILLLWATTLCCVATFCCAAEPRDAVLRVGIIGLDTSHSVAFTKLLNAPQPEPAFANCRVVAAYPHGSPNIESSTSRIPRYTEEIQQFGVAIVDSIEQLLERVDAVLLETNDGRPHLQQLRPVLRAGKPVFVDKPFAGSLSDAVTMVREARRANVPIFSSSALRYVPATQQIRGGEIGRVLGCTTYSPCALEPTHPDLFWYGIHGVESLFTVMGRGCQSVVRISTPETDVVVGTWQGGRIGVFRGMRQGQRGYGGFAFGSKSNRDIGTYSGYQPLVAQIVRFFRSGVSPVDPDETVEIYAFMEAADESKRRGGVPVSLAEVLAKAGSP